MRFADQLTDWLLTRCPFSALALLTVLVLASTLGVSRLWTMVFFGVGADVVLYFVRRNRRVTKPGRRSDFNPRATA